MKIEVINVLSFPSTDPKRLGQTDSLVFYRVDKIRADSVTIAKANPTAQEIETAVSAQIKAKAPLIGHSFEVK